MLVLSAVKKERKKETCIVAQLLNGTALCCQKKKNFSLLLSMRTYFFRQDQAAQWQCLALSQKKKSHCC